ncbi:MAG: hypothetical protein OEZ36_14270, partial [Spirochaetota bacterium]|nr:hypothetical protein [Spirochaetota bacterium]
MYLKLTELEKKQLLIWADNTMTGGHWGNGNVVFPEEANTLQKINTSSSNELTIEERDLKTMIIWAENAIGKTLKGMTSEEISLINKL